MMPLAAALLVVATTGQFTAPTPRMPSGTAIPPRTPGLGRSNDCGVYLMGCTPATAALVPREAALWERIGAKIEVTDTSLHSYIFVGGAPSRVRSRKRADAVKNRIATVHAQDKRGRIPGPLVSFDAPCTGALSGGCDVHV